MQILDRLGWAAGLAFEAYGVRLGLRTTDRSLLPRLVDLLPYGSNVTDDVEVDHLFSLLVGDTERNRTVTLYSHADAVARHDAVEPVLERLDTLVHLLIGEFAKGRVFVHAGVVGWNGRAILIPGRTFTGKSRLVAALVAAGATFFSDEYAVLDEQGLVHPFPRPLSIRDETTHCGRPVLADELGGGPVASEPAPPGLIILSRYEEGAWWEPTSLSPGRALLALLENTLCARRRPEESLATLERVAKRAPAITGTRGEAADIAGGLLETVR